MPKTQYTKTALKEAIAGKLQRHFACEVEDATKDQVYEACALVVRDALTEHMIETQNEVERDGERQVHYLCMEFLVGRSLRNNAYNLGMLDALTAALKDMGFEMADIFEEEADPGLGNGGLGRLAACYMDGMATDGVRGTGYSIRYEHGIFKQKIVEGQQVELPDSWLSTGEVWQIPAMDETREVKIGGTVDTYFDDNGKLVVNYHDYTPVLAVPYDMPISGYGTNNIARLRLWKAQSPIALDMKLFSSGEYLKALEKHALAETISMVLYPEDNHREGQSLRLKQQYFLVSATLQDICAKHKAKYGTLENFAHKHVLHINDTHPTLVIPELMRILMDENDMSWEQAWNITSQSVAYTNHTVMPEALECWPVSLVQELMPRVMQIIYEINERFCKELWNYFPNDFQKISKLAIVADDTVRMAHLAIAAGHSVNGVARLHTEILKKQELKDFYEMMPEKFNNKTNGITQRRFLLHGNPLLADWVTDKIGNEWITDLSNIKKLSVYVDDEKCQQEFMNIKYQNKIRLAKYIKEHNGIDVDPRSIFDVQVKRLHEYKRQLMNILHVMYLYNQLKDNPNMDIVPRTFIFGAKAAAGYKRAKLTIKLINNVANVINNDKSIGGKLKVVFIEDYRVSNAELIFSAADVSEQISTASKEASGTGNMKFMLNGALTIGTMDGANVEMAEEVGKDNMFIFGASADEIINLENNGGYNPMDIFNNDQDIRRVLMQLINGYYSPQDPELFRDIYNSLLNTQSSDRADTYFILKDFRSYAEAHKKIDQAYRDEKWWARTAMLNTASAGKFSSDRTIEEYVRDIWHLEKIKVEL